MVAKCKYPVFASVSLGKIAVFHGGTVTIVGLKNSPDVGATAAPKVSHHKPNLLYSFAKATLCVTEIEILPRKRCLAALNRLRSRRFSD